MFLHFSLSETVILDWKQKVDQVVSSIVTLPEVWNVFVFKMVAFPLVYSGWHLTVFTFQNHHSSKDITFQVPLCTSSIGLTYCSTSHRKKIVNILHNSVFIQYFRTFIEEFTKTVQFALFSQLIHLLSLLHLTFSLFCPILWTDLL